MTNVFEPGLAGNSTMKNIMGVTQQAIKTFKDRDDWMRAINASSLPHTARCLAFGIALHLNIKTGRCDPGYDLLVKEVGISRRSIGRLVALLKRSGWLGVKRGGAGQTNSYLLLVQKCHSSGTSRSATALAHQTDSEVPTGALRSATALALLDVPHGGTQKANLTTKKRRKESLPRFFAPTAGREGGFEEFWAAFPRKVAKETARKRFATAVKGGAEPATIIAAARRYREERAGQPPRYTKHPTTWLQGQCWLDEPMADADNGLAPPIRNDAGESWDDIEQELRAEIRERSHGH
jgi:hypothetical protein